MSSAIPDAPDRWRNRSSPVLLAGIRSRRMRLHFDITLIRADAECLVVATQRRGHEEKLPSMWERILQVRIGESRRSTRVPLMVAICAQGIPEPLLCDGETIIVSCHGALIYCSAPLHVGQKIEIRVILTAKHASAEVVYVDPARPQICGIALAKPENIWGLSFPPHDWHEDTHAS